MRSETQIPTEEGQLQVFRISTQSDKLRTQGEKKNKGVAGMKIDQSKISK